MNGTGVQQGLGRGSGQDGVSPGEGVGVGVGFALHGPSSFQVLQNPPLQTE